MASLVALKAAPCSFVAHAAAPRRQRLVVCAAQQQEAAPLARRSLLASLALLAASSAGPSQAAIGGGISRWDGESSAEGSCALGAAGDDCRMEILRADSAEFASYDQQMASKSGKVGSTAGNVPVADLSTAYARDTIALTDKILQYAAFDDPTDPARFQVIKELKGEMPKWVSNYARGGSVRATSARKVYVVVDAISAHFATNGLAPIPRMKMAKLVADVEAGRQALAEGK